MNTVRVVLLALLWDCSLAQAHTTPILDVLRAADIREQQTPSGKKSRSSAPMPFAVRDAVRDLQASGRIPELALALEHNEALRSDARLYEFGVAVLLQTTEDALPEQVDFMINHLCDAPLSRRIVQSAPFHMLPQGERARMAAALLDCAETAEYEIAARMIAAMSTLDRCSPVTNADLRSLVQKAPGRFDAMWVRVSAVVPEPVQDRPPEDQPSSVKWGNAEWAVRMSAARALFTTTPDLAAELDWFDRLAADSKWLAVGGMIEALRERQGRRFPLREVPQATQQRYLATLEQAAGNQHLRAIWNCCISMWINGVVQDPSYDSAVRATAARSMAAIHASYPETADKAPAFLQKAAELSGPP